MAEVWVAAAATVVVGAYSADQQSKAGKAGAAAQQAASNAATAEERRQYDQTRQDQLPFMEAGYDSLRRQTAALNGDLSGFENSPDYLYARDQGIQSLDRSAAAKGGYTGGGADADRMTFASGLASQNFNNYWDRLRGRAGQGQGSAQNLGGYGAQMAGNIGNNLMNGASARASSYANTANAWGNFGQQAVGAFNQWYGNRPTGAQQQAVASGGAWG